MTETPLKTCIKCKCEKPATTEYFSLNRKKLNSKCKDCVKEYLKAYFQKPGVKENRNKYQKSYRKIKGVTESEKERQREYQKSYRQRPSVKERHNEYQKAYRQRLDVKERYNEYLKEYNIRLDVKERVRERRKAHFQKPDVKEQRRAYLQRPEVKKSRNEYLKSYLQTQEYMASLLGFKKDEIPPEMIETKRLTIFIKREIKQVLTKKTDKNEKHRKRLKP
jgi:hypothetical protein